VALYAEITEIVAPSSAAAGSRVDIQVKIKNKYTSAIGMMVGGALEYGVSPWLGITFPTSTANVNAGVTCIFSGYFTMPSKGVTIHAYSYWYGADGTWHFDDEKTKNVSLTPAYKGTITSVVIRKDSSDLSVPASLKMGDSCELHAFGRNDNGATRMGMEATITKPDGSVITGKHDMTTQQDQGQTLRFSIANISVNQAGTYSAQIRYYTLP